MTRTELRFQATRSAGEVSAILVRPENARRLYVFAHGAGAGMRHHFMEKASDALAAKEIATEKETYIAGDVEDVEAAVSAAFAGGDLQPRALAAAGAATTMIVDPPATGLTEGARTAIIDLTPDTLIYVSCNPSTLARDLRHLREKFAIESVTPLDMFPQTAEIEVVAHLRAA
jgi:23S rRNA (uracil1939-C5)-methyltransferase